MKTVLLVDDDVFLRRIMACALSAEGLTTLETDNGVQGIQLSRRYLPDLIICDVEMESMDGLETLAALRKDAVTRSIPVIMMSGGPEVSWVPQAIELGADQCLPKPFTHFELLASIKSFIEIPISRPLR